MQRICRSLALVGHDVTLVGRVLKTSSELRQETYKQVRIKCWFEKGFLFYAEFNIRLFINSLKTDADTFCAIDLDTMLAVSLAAKWRNIPVVYDAHEHFTEMEEVVHRPFVRAVWKAVERKCVPSLRGAYTVSQTIADTFKVRYGMDMMLVRNMAVYDETYTPTFNLKERIILYQGAVNHGRGLFALVSAMKHVDACLLICGTGSVYADLKRFTCENGLEEKVAFKGRVMPDVLLQITRSSTLGITLFEAEGKSNYYSLANRYFDYLQAGIPQLAMQYPEYQHLNTQYEVACLIPAVEVDLIAKALNKLLSDRDYYKKLHNQACVARKEWNWQNEAKKLEAFYGRLAHK
jgi:glycosyltransferase involved in cell wall biosynthesis